MKRFLSFYIVLGLVFSLVLPVFLMAATLNILTSDGNNITLNKPYISFTTDVNGNITILFEGKNTDLGTLQLEPLILISGTGVNNATGTVTGTKGTPVTFTVSTTDSELGNPTHGGLDTLTLSYMFPAGEAPFVLTPGSTSTGVFSKIFSTAGVYYVIFKASYDPDGLGTASQPFVTLRTITIAIDQQQTCQATVTAQAAGTGGAITSALSQTVDCGTTVTFSGTLTSGATATVSEGNYSSSNGLNWNWIVTAPTTATTKNVTITFSTPTSCQSTVTALASGTGGAITSATSQTVNCGTTATFSGTLTSGATATVSEGNYSSSNGLNWTWGVTASTTNGQTKNVTITFSPGTPPPPPTGNCDKLGASCAAQVASATSLNFVACTGMDKDYFGYIASQVSTCNSTTTRVAAGATAWFLVDASKVTVPAGFTKPPYQMTIYVADYAQSAAQMQATLYPLDANNNLSTADAYIAYGTPGPPYNIGLENNQGVTYMLYKSQRYLVNVVGNGSALSIWYGR